MADYNRPGTFIAEQLTPLTASVAGIAGQALPCFAAAYNIGPTVPVLISSWQQYITLYGGFAQAGGNYLPFAVSQYFANGGSACYVLRVANTDAVAASLVLADIKAVTPDSVLTVASSAPGAYGSQIYVGVTAVPGTTLRSSLTVYQGGTSAANIVEQFLSVSMNPADPRNIVSIVNSPATGSRFVTLTATLPGGAYIAGTNDLAVLTPTALASGADGVTAPVLGTAVPNSLDQLQQQILNVNLPGVTSSTTVNALAAWAAGRGDVEIVIDGPAPSFPETSSQVVTNYTTLAGTFTSSTYNTIYSPWLLVQDPSSSLPGATRWLPPAGAVLGRWNSTDTAVGVQQSPAGTTYGQVQALALEVSFTPADLDALNTANINAIKAIPGSGFCIFGARTQTQGYPDRYIAVRRTLQKLEHDMVNLTLFAVFAPNQPSLWDQVASVLTNYLTEQMQVGLLAGTTPATSFSVVCDSTVNTNASAQAGIVNATVAVALLSPAEFIIINIQQLQTSATATTTGS